jgi:hypothetical protein
LHQTTRLGDVPVNTAKVIFEGHRRPNDPLNISGLFARCRQIEAAMGYLTYGMTNQTNEALAYIEREYEDVKGRVEHWRRVVEQLHMAGADTSEAEASLNALLDDQALKLRIVDYLRKWLSDKFEVTPAP